MFQEDYVEKKILVLVFIVTCLTVIGTLSLYQIGVKGQPNDLITYLTKALTKTNVPVKEIEMDGDPMQVTIVLQGKSPDRNALPGESWLLHLAYREAALATRQGFQVASSKVILLNAAGEEIYWRSDTFNPTLYPHGERQDFR